jgi:hypothetical protein
MRSADAAGRGKLIHAPDLMARARSAFYTSTLKAGQSSLRAPEPSEHLRECGGRRYAVLADGNGILAVYAVSANDRLRRVDAWPEELAGI